MPGERGLHFILARNSEPTPFIGGCARDERSTANEIVQSGVRMTAMPIETHESQIAGLSADHGFDLALRAQQRADQSIFSRRMNSMVLRALKAEVGKGESVVPKPGLFGDGAQRGWQLLG